MCSACAAARSARSRDPHRALAATCSRPPTSASRPPRRRERPEDRFWRCDADVTLRADFATQGPSTLFATLDRVVHRVVGLGGRRYRWPRGWIEPRGGGAPEARPGRRRLDEHGSDRSRPHRPRPHRCSRSTPTAPAQRTECRATSPSSTSVSSAGRPSFDPRPRRARRLGRARARPTDEPADRLFGARPSCSARPIGQACTSPRVSTQLRVRPRSKPLTLAWDRRARPCTSCGGTALRSRSRRRVQDPRPAGALKGRRHVEV